MTGPSREGSSVRGGGERMYDVLMVLLMVGFFVLAGFFVAWLDRV